MYWNDSLKYLMSVCFVFDCDISTFWFNVDLFCIGCKLLFVVGVFLPFSVHFIVCLIFCTLGLALIELRMLFFIVLFLYFFPPFGSFFDVSGCCYVWIYELDLLIDYY